jgi:alpha-amylase/alpha-mannosidase (GH57 family)
MEKFICIHGHFYQPPRENPWLEAIELQDSASPYHDWNERVAAECYAPNAHARFLDGEGRIDRIVNNYARISFNFGPTLLAWMKKNAADVYQAVLEADKQSQKRFGGHGSALAQCYNHVIMPLANPRDRETQVIWGIRDFEHRFGRRPEGMWLPETAADNASLEALAAQGIKFTILSPQQASRSRRMTLGKWREVGGGVIDPSRPYEVRLSSGRKLSVFFYDGPVSQAIAFEQLLTDGKTFAHRLMEGFDDARDWEQLVHVATDGESYGHHHRYGEMALAYALHFIESNKMARLTNYGEYLERHPPRHEVEIHQGSAWSCAHGVERWRSNCGCNSGGRPGWNQGWRAPLREALDWLRDQMAPKFEAQARELLKDPWRARNAYIAVILDRSPENVRRFLGEQGTRPLNDAERVKAIELLELQRHAMLMYTSCGWFFDELSGIETVQVIQYAGRVIQLARELFGDDPEPGFLKILEKAKSNIREHRDGRRIYEKFVKPATVDWERLCAHYSISSLFESYPEKTRIHAYTFETEDRQVLTAGRARLAVGRAKVSFDITGESEVLSYGVLHMGDHNLNGGVRRFRGQEAYEELKREMIEPFDRADFPQIIRVMDRHFGESNFSLKSLFRDEQRKVLTQILTATREDLEGRYRLIMDRYTPLMRFLVDLGAPAPGGLRMAAELVLNSELRRLFDDDAMDLARVRELLEQSEKDQIALDVEMLAYGLSAHLDRLSGRFVQAPEDLPTLQRFEEIAQLLRSLPFEINLWKTQNTYYTALKTVYPSVRERAEHGEEHAQAWLLHFLALGEQLGFRANSQPKDQPDAKG